MIESNNEKSGGSRISPRWGHQPSRGRGGKHTICSNFPKNCMKLKKFGRGASKILLCRSATGKVGIGKFRVIEIAWLGSLSVVVDSITGIEPM